MVWGYVLTSLTYMGLPNFSNTTWKSQQVFKIDINKLILKSIQKYKGPRIAKTMLTKTPQRWISYITWLQDSFGFLDPVPMYDVCVHAHWIGGISHTIPNNSLASTRCPRIQLNSDTTYPEIASDSTGKGLSHRWLTPPRTPHPLQFRCPLQAQIVICASDQLAIDWGFQWLPPTLDFRHQSQVQVATYTSDQLAIDQRFLGPLPRVWLIYQSSSWNSKKHFTYQIAGLL